MKPFKIKNGLSASKYLQSSANFVTDVDLTLGQHLTASLGTSNTTLTFSNPPEPNVATSFTVEVSGNVLDGSGFQFEDIGYYQLSLDPSATLTSVCDAKMTPDGLKLFLVSSSDSTIYVFNPPAPFQIDNAEYSGVSFDASSQASSITSVVFKGDGTKMYVLDSTTNSVYQYSLSTAWDLSSASYEFKSFNFTSQDTAAGDLAFNSDGTKAYVLGITNSKVFQFSLAVSWDINTASYDSVDLTLASSANRALDLVLDGTKLYIADSANIYQYTLSTAYDLSTATYDSLSYSSAEHNNSITSLSWSSNGANVHICNTTVNTIQALEDGASPVSLTWPSSVVWAEGVTPSSPTPYKSDLYNFFVVDGGSTYYGNVVAKAVEK